MQHGIVIGMQKEQIQEYDSNQCQQIIKVNVTNTLPRALDLIIKSNFKFKVIAIIQCMIVKGGVFFEGKWSNHNLMKT